MAAALMELGIEVATTKDFEVSLDLRACGLPQIGQDAVAMSPGQALILAAALVTVATTAKQMEDAYRDAENR